MFHFVQNDNAVIAYYLWLRFNDKNCGEIDLIDIISYEIISIVDDV